MPRWSTVLMLFSLVLVLGCVDTAEPTGPAPTPPEDDGGELTPGAVTVAGTAQAAESARASARTGAPR